MFYTIMEKYLQERVFVYNFVSLNASLFSQVGCIAWTCLCICPQIYVNLVFQNDVNYINSYF